MLLTWKKKDGKRPTPRVRFKGYGDDGIDHSYYTPHTNTITLMLDPDSEYSVEEEVMHALLHETDHWAQLMFFGRVSGDEIATKQGTGQGGRGARAPMLERINTFRSKGWGFKKEHDRWIEKVRW